MNKEPVIGQKVYVPTSLHVYRGCNDFAGGLATINVIENSKTLPSDHYNYCMVGIEEKNKSAKYNWNYLMENQEKWSEEYKGKIAHHDPDYSEEFNCSLNADWKTI